MLEALRRQHVPRKESEVRISPNWEIYRRRNAVAIVEDPERLTSNWIRIVEAPDTINFFEPKGFTDVRALREACRNSPFPIEPHQNGFFSFGTESEINKAFAQVGIFAVTQSIPLILFKDQGSKICKIQAREASNIVHSMFRQAWNSMCRRHGLLEYKYSIDIGFHVSESQAKIGQKIGWGRQGDRRSSMLRNIAKGHVWHFGITATPAFWPFPHFKLKSRVLFSPSPVADIAPIDPLVDAKKQHRLRRTICKGWRNKQWHGRIMAFIEILSGESSFITLPLADNAILRLEAAPLLFTSLVSTPLPNVLDDEDEEIDETTLGRPEYEDDL